MIPINFYAASAKKPDLRALIPHLGPTFDYITG
jgi:hypothetical protein